MKNTKNGKVYGNNSIKARKGEQNYTILRFLYSARSHISLGGVL